jgi:hypothetical protein
MGDIRAVLEISEYKDPFDEYAYRTGRLLDEKLREYFKDNTIAVRCIDSKDQSHLGWSREKLADYIENNGTDKHESNIVSVGSEDLKRSGVSADLSCYVIDLRAVSVNFMEVCIDDLYNWASCERKKQVFFDIIVIYKLEYLTPVPYNFQNGTQGKDAFLLPKTDKKCALWGILELQHTKK